MKSIQFDLLTTVETGCSAKIPPRALEELLKDFPVPTDPRILVDISSHDDAGRIQNQRRDGVVITTDFFPPMVSDGYDFGLVAATNSISDVYAMGGTPLLWRLT
jgi:selenide, water dikinase